jgi:hypothetical protein
MIDNLSMRDCDRLRHFLGINSREEAQPNIGSDSPFSVALGQCKRRPRLRIRTPSRSELPGSLSSFQDKVLPAGQAGLGKSNGWSFDSY